MTIVACEGEMRLCKKKKKQIMKKPKKRRTTIHIHKRICTNGHTQYTNIHARARKAYTIIE